MSRKYIQPQRFQTHQNKEEAILLVERYINEHIAEFKDGEEIAIEHKDAQGEQMYSTAIIKKSGNTAKVYASVESNETLRIVESEEEPKDRSVIWLSEEEEDESESGETSNLREEIKSLKSVIKKMEEMVNRHDYALSSTIAGGDIILNSEKYALENDDDPEQPQDAKDYTEYATDDLVVDSFEVFIADSPLTRFSGADASLYMNQNYFLKFKLYNAGKEQVKNDGSFTMTINHGSDVKYIHDKQVIVGLQSGYTTIYATVTNGSDVTLENTYPLSFEYNEKPGYETYAEPNVKHFILKSVKNLQILKDNFNYLCVNEPIWCISECALYVKGEMADGSVALFKISGGSGGDDPIIPDPDTGSTSGDTAVTSETIYTIDDNDNLTVVSTNNAVYVDEDGILNINAGYVDQNGILILNDVTTTGSTSGNTSGDTSGSTSGDTSTAIVDDEGNMNVGGTTTVDENGILLLNATIDSNGILEITS